MITILSRPVYPKKKGKIFIGRKALLKKQKKLGDTQDKRTGKE
jgi:hypothetical protein